MVGPDTRGKTERRRSSNASSSRLRYATMKVRGAATPRAHQRRSVRIPHRFALNRLEPAAPPGTHCSISIHYVQARLRRLRHVTDILQSIRRARIGDDREPLAVWRSFGRPNPSRQQHHCRWNGGSFMVLEREDRKLALLVYLPCAIEFVSVGRESHRRKVV
jgi:hypothetical protein